MREYMMTGIQSRAIEYNNDWTFFFQVYFFEEDLKEEVVVLKGSRVKSEEIRRRRKSKNFSIGFPLFFRTRRGKSIPCWLPYTWEKACERVFGRCNETYHHSFSLFSEPANFKMKMTGRKLIIFKEFIRKSLRESCGYETSTSRELKYCRKKKNWLYLSQTLRFILRGNWQNWKNVDYFWSSSF